VIERTLSAPLARVYTAEAERPAKARWFGGAPGRREVPIHTTRSRATVHLRPAGSNLPAPGGVAARV